ncbi:Uncharacterized protein APZ42_021429 [Daphnia magna]|uniref:Uncharacterized protein n=1 Tax=Daphnia magna TaxID=35525 RepID=A0A0P5XGS1_9CRUS|nr:Uncharacterized protein APZ42_021429 [Daphnia magna]
MKKRKKRRREIGIKPEGSTSTMLEFGKNAWLYKPVTSPPVYPKKSIPNQ